MPSSDVNEKLRKPVNVNWGMILAAMVTRDVVSSTDKVFAASQAWSETGYEELEWGPCDWMPISDALPQRGDFCRIAFDNNRTPFIIWWQSGDGLVTPPIVPGDFRYVHDQGIASATWHVNHALDGYPAVTVVDSALTRVHGDVQYVDANNVTLVFSAPFSGHAFFS